MLLLLGPSGEANDRIIEAMTSFLEKLWYARNRDYKVFPFLNG